MTRVIAIESAQNRQYIVTIEHNKKVFKEVVTEDTIIRLHLLSPRDISYTELKQLKEDGKQDLLYQKSLHFVNYQMRSIKEVKDFLKRQKAEKDVLEKVLKRLKEQGFLNDARFAKMFCEEKMNFDTIGPKKIRQQLIQKGIHFDLIDQNLRDFDSRLSQEKILTLLEKETRYPIKKTLQKAKTSFRQKCVTRGFDLDDINLVLSHHTSLLKEACMDQVLLDREMNKLLQRYDIKDYKDKDTIIKKLLSKGFSYDAIKEKL
jgi:regulatory protein